MMNMNLSVSDAQVQAAEALLTLYNLPLENKIETTTTPEIATVIPPSKTAKSKSKRKRREKADNITELMRPPYLFITLPNSDVRYGYPARLFANVKDHNIDNFQKVFPLLVSPDVKVIQEYDGEQNPFGENKTEINGLDNLISVATLQVTSNPDVTFQISNTRVQHDAATNVAYIRFILKAVFTKVSKIVTVNEAKRPATDIMNQIMGTSFPSSSSAATTTNTNIIKDTSDVDSFSSNSSNSSSSTPDAYNNRNGSSSIHSSPQPYMNFEDSLDLITTRLNTFQLEPIAERIATAEMTAQYCLITGSDMKIHTMYRFFKISPIISKNSDCSGNSSNSSNPTENHFEDNTAS